MDIKEKIKTILALLAVIATGIWVAIADGGAIPVIVAVVGTPILLAGIVFIIRADGESDASEAASTSITPTPAKAAPAPAADTRQADAAVAKSDASGAVPVPTTPTPAKAAPAPAADTRKATSKTNDNLKKGESNMAKTPANKPSEKQTAPATNNRMPISLDDLERMSATKKSQLTELCLCRGKDVPVDLHINMSPLFSECSSLKRLDLSYFRLAHVFDLEGMLKNCTKLKEVVLSDTIQQCTMQIPTGETERKLVPVPMEDMEPNYSLGAQPSHAYADCDPYRYEDVPVMKRFVGLTDKRRREFLGLVDGAKLTIVPHRTPPAQEVKPLKPTRQQNDEPSSGPRDVPSMMKSLEQEYMGDDWQEHYWDM